MKIKDVEINVIRTYGRSLRIPAAAVSEKKIRGACLGALRKADAKGLGSLVLAATGLVGKRFPASACAKIMAQEVFRYIRERDSHHVKKISIAVSSAKVFGLFKETVCSYLAHIADKLSSGPFVTVDAIIETAGGIVLIKRSNPPFGWAIPGGFVDYGETLEQAARREAKEETGLDVEDLTQMHTYSDPSRDPRFHTVTTVFVCRGKGRPRAASDAAAVRVFRPGAWRNVQLAFDHKKVLEDYLERQRR